MPYVEVSKNGKVVKRRELDPAKGEDGYRVRLGEGVQVRLKPGQSAKHGEYEIRVIDDVPDGAVPSDHGQGSLGPNVTGEPGRPATSPASLDAADTLRPGQGTVKAVAKPHARQNQPGKDALPAIDGYDIIGRLGEGGMGVVWHAKQLGTNRQVALKLLGKGAFASERTRQRFEREVELCARLEHPCIAGIYDSGVHRGVYFYAMEHIVGAHLDAYVRDEDLSDREILALMRDVCQAVQHAHQRGVIHRDLKPSNVMVSPDGRPHVLDFGLARTFQEEDKDKGYTISIDGEIAGTPAYMAPEQAAGRNDQMDTRTDVYTLGVILFRLLTGEYPHEMTGSKYDLIRRIVEDDPRRPRDVYPGIDREVESLLLKAMAKAPSDRYASAGEMAEDISNYLSGDPLRARPATTWYFLRKRVRKYWGRVAIAAAMAVAMIAVAGWAYARVAQERNRAESARIAAERERDHAEEQQALAARERARAEQQAARAERQTARAEQEKATAQGEAYAGKMLLAEMALERGDQIACAGLLSDSAVELRSWEWGHLSARVRSKEPCERLVVNDKSGGIAAFSADMTRIAFSGEGNIQIDDTLSGRRLMTLQSGTIGCSSITFSPNGQYLAVGTYDGTVRVWTLQDGKELFRRPTAQEAKDRRIESLVFSRDSTRLAFGGYDHQPGKVYEVATGRLLLELPYKGSRALSVALSPDNTRIVTGYRDGHVRVWDQAKGRLLTQWVACDDNKRAHHRSILCMAYSPDGKTLATANGDTMSIWNPNTGERLVSNAGHNDRAILCLAFSPDGKRVITGCYGGRTNETYRKEPVRIWSTRTGRELLRLKFGANMVTTVGFSADGLLAAAANDSREAMIWSASPWGDKGMSNSH